MSSKSTLQVSVEANTSKASTQLKQFKSTVDSLNGGNKSLFDTSKISSATSEFNKIQQQLSNKDFSGLGKSINEMAGGLTKLPSLASVGGAALGGLGIAATAVGVELKKMTDRGIESYKEFEKFNVTFQNIDRNIGGVGRDFTDFSNKLQLMSANGSNSFEELGSAAQTLLVAFNGDKKKTMELISVFDDLSAGTGIAVSELAGMAAEAQNTGVSIKDLQRLSNKGIPIYQALAQAMGVSADEAESMAKRHMVTTENLFEAYSKLKDIYKGLSQELSSSTLEGAEATFAASQKLRDQSIGEGYAEERKGYLNARSQEMQNDAASPSMQAFNNALGKVTASLKNFGDELTRIPEMLIVSGASLFDKITGGSLVEKYQKNQARKDKLEFDKGFKNREQMTSAQLKDLINMISGDKWGAFSNADGTITEDYVNKRKQLRELYNQKVEAEQAEQKWNQQQAELDRKSQMLLKYSNNVQDIIKSLSGRNGLPQFETIEQIPGIIARIKKGLIEGTSTNEGQDEANLKILEDVYKRGQDAAQNASRAEEELIKQRKAAADAALEAKNKENQAYIQGKAEIGRNITSAQENYDSVTAKLERLRAERQVIADEEAHGIYRKKWGNLDVSDMSTQESELVRQQEEAGKKLEALKDKYDKFDENWQKSAKIRDQVMNNIISKLPITVRNLASLAG